MKIDFYCYPGSRSFIFTPPDVHGRGLGGAELSLVCLTKALAKRGHEVTVYNVPQGDDGESTAGYYGGVRYAFSVPEFKVNEKRDVFVLFRNAFPHIENVQARCKLFWSCDQVTAGHYGTDVYPFVDRAILISRYHAEDHVIRYDAPGHKIVPIDLGVILEEYRKPLPKVPGKLVFCSVPHRGLQWLKPIYLALKALHPDISLYITADYTLWGRGISAQDMRGDWIEVPGVYYLGNVPRETLVAHQLTADLMIYPHYPVNGLPELFGISVAEAMAAGIVPIVSAYGGLQCTVPDGVVIRGDPREPDIQAEYVEVADFLLRHRETELIPKQEEMREYAHSRFNWDRIARDWEKVMKEVMENAVSDEG